MKILTRKQITQRTNMQILRIITVLAFGVTSAFAQDTVSHPYYPLSVGAEWKYDFDYGRGIVSRTVEKAIGDTLFYVKEQLNFGLVLATMDWEKLVVRKSGIYMVAFKSMDDPEYIELNPPRLVLPLPLKVGIKWEDNNHRYEVTEHIRDATKSNSAYRLFLEDLYIIETVNSKTNLRERYRYALNYGWFLVA